MSTRSPAAVVLLGIVLLLVVGWFTWSRIYQPEKTPTPSITDVEPTLLPTTATTEKGEPLKTYFVALEDGGVYGTLIGCNDSLVAVDTTISRKEAGLKGAYERLLLVKRPPEQQGLTLYSALQQSSLKVTDASISEFGLATVTLTGDLRLGGVCDNPRLEEQLKQTAFQFPEVTSVEIVINGQPLEEIVSNKGV